MLYNTFTLIIPPDVIVVNRFTKAVTFDKLFLLSYTKKAKSFYIFSQPLRAIYSTEQDISFIA